MNHMIEKEIIIYILGFISGVVFIKLLLWSNQYKKTQAKDFYQNVEGEDGWTDWHCPDPNEFKHACCDCGLIHDVQLKLDEENDKRIVWRWKRHEL